MLQVSIQPEINFLKLQDGALNIRLYLLNFTRTLAYLTVYYSTIYKLKL